MRLVLPLFVAALLVGCSSSAPVEPVAPATAPLPTPAVEAPAAETPERDMAAMEALYWQRRREAMTYTEADVTFMQGMIGHHAQALVMADMARNNGASAAVQRLAARIDNAQTDEIATMQRWLRDRGQAVPEVQIEGYTLTIRMAEPSTEAGNTSHDGMDHGQMDHEGMDHSAMDHGAMDHSDHGGMHGGMDHSGMPGMLTDAQLAELGAARGAEFDRLFLTYMIQHHQGAVVMVDVLFSHDGAAQDDGSFKLASEIRAEQTAEIAMMQLMLDSLTDSTFED
ncbi:MAG: DUF305 domain-containing protein [Bacteroidota bacterium]